MRRRIIPFLTVFIALAVIITLTAANGWFFGAGDTEAALAIGVPIQALRQAVGDLHEIGETDAVSESPFGAVFVRVVHQKTELRVGGGILIEETVGEENASSPDYILFTFIPDGAQAWNLTFSEDFLPYYDKSALENGAYVYRRSGRSVMPTTEYTDVDGGKLVTVYSVCDFVICPGKDSVSWAVCNSELTDEDARLIANYLQNEK